MKILRKLTLPLTLVFFALVFLLTASPNEAAAACTGGTGFNQKCIVKGFVFVDTNSDGKSTGDVGKNNVTIKLWRERANGTKYQQENSAFSGKGNLGKGNYRYFKEPAGNNYHIQAVVPSGWECTTGNCSDKTFTFNAQNETRTINFGMREKSGDGDNKGCQKVAPEFDPSELSKSPGENGKVLFKFDLKNKNNKKCGKSTYNLSPKDLPDGWSPVFKGNINANNKVKDLRYGKTRKDIKLIVTPPSDFSGNESFMVEAQDPENANLKATIALTATVGDGGDNGDDGDDEEEGGGAVPGGTLHFQIGLDGIGSTGDRQNPSCKFSNKEPETASINVDVRLFKASDGTLVRTFENVQAEYEPSPEDEDCSQIPSGDEGRYVADINLPQGFITGGYFIEVASDKPFRDQRSGLVNLTAGATNSPGPINLAVGDINGDDVINVADWSLLNECLKRGRSPSCTQNNTTYKIDLNDDGKIFNEVGFWLREFFRLE